jgi:hypothetical protein
MINASETYVIGVDIADNDVSTLTIARKNGDKLDRVKILTGKDARDLYSTLSTEGAEDVIIRDYGKAYCPRCDTGIYGIGRINYCPRCSQKLKWPNSENMKPLIDSSIYEQTAENLYKNSTILKGGNKND